MTGARQVTQRMHALRQSGVAFRGGLGQFEHSKERPPRGSISPVRGCCWAVHRGILRELAYLSAGAGIAPWWWDMLAYILGSNGQRLGLSLKRTAATAGAGPAARSTRGRPLQVFASAGVWLYPTWNTYVRPPP